MGGDQVIIHVRRMGCGVADPGKATDPGEFTDQPAEPPFPSAQSRRWGGEAWRFAVISVDVLAQQGDFRNAARHQGPGLSDDVRRRARVLRPSGVGNDAKCAEFIAPFLNRDKRRGFSLAARFGQGIELRPSRKIGLEDGAAARRILHHLCQVLVVLRSEDDIDERCTALYFLAFGLGDTTADTDQHGPATAGRGILHGAQASEFRIDLLRRFFTDMTGVEDDQIRRLGRRRHLKAHRRQDVRHARGIVDVHLAAIGFNEKLFHQIHVSTCVTPTPGVGPKNRARAPPLGGGNQCLSNITTPIVKMSTEPVHAGTDFPHRPELASAAPARTTSKQCWASALREPYWPIVTGS